MSKEAPRELLEMLVQVRDGLSQCVSAINRYLQSHVPPEVQEALEIEDVERRFPKELAGQVTFSVTEDHIIVKPRGYLGTDTFAKIASIVRDQLGGEYVSAGKDSHFIVPRRR